MAKSTLLIEERLALIEERVAKLEGKPGSDWQPLNALVTHQDNPYPRWTLVGQMRAAIKDPKSSPLKDGMHFTNTSGRYYVRPLPYLRAMGVVIDE